MSTPEFSPTANSGAPPKATTVPVSTAEREIRFAVVMYGGVSLAIYINGVAQELLNMVRATAPAPEGSTHMSGLLLDENGDDTKGELSGTAAVYRKLGQYLGNPQKLTESATPDKDGKLPGLVNDPIKTRFIVDVISGTSAGGINGVFLAKAIVRNQKMDGLKQLWLREGDLRKLLNDSFSVSDLAGFSVQKPQQSLLNSQRMYRKLLEALDEMDQSGSVSEREENEKNVSPLVGELDLFITTTDIEGIPLSISLADDVVYERRFKNVFHFRYANKSAAGSSRDDFVKSNDPFLAFAARCTSSFPFAFEAMCLADIREVLVQYPAYKDTEWLLDGRGWDKFFTEYLRLGLYDLDKGARRSERSAWPTFRSTSDALQDAVTKLRSSFQSRPFGDGGYLDNKPFTYATRMLMRRTAGNVFAERKLLYVEPSPEHPELAPPPRIDRRPDFAENVRAAVLDLPRRETIREDLAQIDERNEMIKRVTMLTENVDHDVRDYHKRRAELIERLVDCKTEVAADLKKYLAAETLSTNAFIDASLGEMIAIYGIGYGGYHRLRVEGTTELLSDIITRIAGYDPTSGAAEVIREIAEEWRRVNYAEEKGTGIPKMENEFLYEFDLAYRLRRLAFLTRRVNDLGRLDDKGELHPNAIDLLYRSAEPQSIGKAEIISRDWVAAFREELKRLKEILGLATIEARVAEEQLFHPTVDIEKDLSDAQKDLVKEAREDGPILSDDRISSLGDDDRALYFSFRLLALVSKLDLRWKEEDKNRLGLSNLLEKIVTKRITAIREGLLQGDDRRRATLQQLADTIRAAFREATSAELGVRLRQGEEQLPANDPRKVARDSLNYYYDNFTFYDLVTYPMQYGTSVGEANIVDVFRVSPEDATALIDEQAVGEHRRKLAGTALMSFGAFIDPAWRKNDMLWGRLDGAERIITVLLPPPRAGEDDPYKTVRQHLIHDAHVAIFKEEVHQTDLVTLQGLLSNMLGRIEPTSAQAQKLREVVQAALIAGKQTLPHAFESALRQCFTDPVQVRDYYEKQFEVNRRFDPENALRLISRATNITGRMLEGLANKMGYDPAKRASAWIARFGSVFWGMVAVAVPSSLGNLLARHWLGLLYVLSFITLMLSIWVPWMAPTGWSALGISVGLNLLLFVLGDIIRGRRFWLRALTILLVVVIAALISGGVLFAVEQLNAAFIATGKTDKNEFITTAGRLMAGVVAGLILIAFVASEWYKGLQQYLVAPHRSFNERRLKWVIAVTLGLGVLLYQIGPPDMVRLEFARTPEAASTFLQHTNKATVRLQLGVDYLFIIAYTVMMASFCIAAAKLFWNSIEHWDGWHYIVAFGFFLAAMQCIAGMCDAAENTGLLWFLSKGAAVGLTVSLYCATVKFVLVAVGALYATIGFGVGIFANKTRRLIPYAIMSSLALVFAVIALRFHPGLGTN